MRDFGRIKGELNAVKIISRFDVEQVVIVSLMPVRGTPVWDVTLPGAEEVAEIIVEARIRNPRARVSLGCARQRGNNRQGIREVKLRSASTQDAVMLQNNPYTAAEENCGDRLRVVSAV